MNLALYVVFHINLNERFADPSLTWPQILAATIVLMFVVYHVNGDRGMALMMTLVVLSFGTFRFSTREGESVHVRVGVSAVDVEGARRNLAAELSTWDFAQYKQLYRSGQPLPSRHAMLLHAH